MKKIFEKYQSIPIIISCIALLIGIYGAILSSINSYYQFFYSSSKIKASVLGCEYIPNDGLTMKIAFSNIGNKDVIIESVYLIAAGKIKDEQENSNTNNNVYYLHLKKFDSLERPLPGSSLPKILKSGELLLIEVNSHFDYANFISKINSSKEYESDIVFVGFEVNLINNKALRSKGRSIRSCLIRNGDAVLIKERDEIIDLTK